MFILRLLLVAGLACGASFAAASAADAGTGRASKACTSLQTLQKELDAVDPSDTADYDADSFKQIGAAFKKASKKAPKQVKASLVTIGKFYDALGGTDSAMEAVQEYGRNGQKYSQAITKFATYYSTACLAVPRGS